MVHPCCDYPLQSSVSCLALYDTVWVFIRTIYHMNELLTTFDAWVVAGKVPDYGPISSSFDGLFVILYVTYFGLSILLIAAAHSQNTDKLNTWVCLTSIVTILQISIFQGSLIFGLTYTLASTEMPPDSFYIEPHREFRVLKIPLQALSCCGIFYTLYELWIVKLFINEIIESADECLSHIVDYNHQEHHQLQHSRHNSTVVNNPTNTRTTAA